MNAAYQNNLIPIVNLRENDACSPSTQLESASTWATQVWDFVHNMSANGVPRPLPMTYFEITNEINQDPYYGYGGNDGPSSCGNCNFASIFATAAAYLSAALNSRNGNNTSPYRILTGGMASATAQATGCPDIGGNKQPTGQVNIQLANNGITTAEGYPDYVPSSRLGEAVHAYHYNTDEYPTFWKNYMDSSVGNRYAGSCGNLQSMINLWSNTYFPNLPLVFTEDNWSDQPCTHSSTCGTDCKVSIVTCEGTYLVDLFTWLQDKSYTEAATSSLRLTWFRGNDVPGSAGGPLGVWDYSGREKYFTTTYCPNNSNVVGNHSIGNDFFYLGNCY